MEKVGKRERIEEEGDCGRKAKINGLKIFEGHLGPWSQEEGKPDLYT